MRANSEFHIHGLAHAGPQVLLLNIDSALSERAFDGAPRREIVFTFKELDLVGCAQFRIIGLDLNCVLVFASFLTDIGDMNPWTRHGNLRGVPDGAWVRVRWLNDD